MQLRSGKTTTKSAIQVTIQLDQGEIYVKSFKEIHEALHYNFSKLEALKSNLERINLFITIFELVQSKIVEIIYLKDDTRYPGFKKLYLTIKDKIPEHIRDISEIVINRVDLDDSEIEEISSCLNLLMKLRKQFK